MEPVVPVRRTLAMRCPLPMDNVPMSTAPLPPGVVVRQLEPGDESELGQLMYDAYLGGVEDHGETLEWHRADAAHTLAGGWGSVLWHASFWATVEGKPAGTTIVTDWAEFNDTGLSFALVDPAARGLGLGAALITLSGAALSATGHRDWVLAVEPNNPALRLYERLGFAVFEPVRKPSAEADARIEDGVQHVDQDVGHDDRRR